MAFLEARLRVRTGAPERPRENQTMENEALKDGDI